MYNLQPNLSIFGIYKAEVIFHKYLPELNAQWGARLCSLFSILLTLFNRTRAIDKKDHPITIGNYELAEEDFG
jgi:hypothetical protein